jgi:hypothetical protein
MTALILRLFRRRPRETLFGKMLAAHMARTMSGLR